MPGSSRGKRVALLADDSSSDDAEEGDFDDGEGIPPQKSPLPKRATPGKKMKQPGSSSLTAVVLGDESSEDPLATPLVAPSVPSDRRVIEISDDEDSDDAPLATPVASNRRQLLKRKAAVDMSDEDEDEDDDDSVVLPAKRRRLTRKGTGVDTSASVDSSATAASDGESPLPATKEKPKTAKSTSTSVKRKSRPTGPKSEKRRQLELLRRRRAGEVIEDLTSEEDEERHGLYDSDASGFMALEEFDDDEEGVPGDEGPAKQGKKSKNGAAKSASKKKGKEKKAAAANDNSSSEEDLEDFITDDDEHPLGVPASLLDIPLEFTAHSHKPLKEHFRHVIEWLVQSKINPAFERKHALYMMAWKKLNDEIQGLAVSKFSSAAWKADFFMALRARPGFQDVEIPRGDLGELNTCMACGRKGHPATWVVSFTGSAYHKDSGSDNFLQEVEGDESDSDDDDDEGEEPDRDEDGNNIPPRDRRWFVGAVCKSNAETAHALTHWKHSLFEWVMASLEAEGYMKPEKLMEREKMKPKKRYKVVDGILEKWEARGTVNDLYRNFKQTIEEARNKSTTGKGGRRWG